MHYFLTEAFYSQQSELLGFEKSNDCGRPPISDRVEIEVEIAIPLSGHRMPIVFSRAEGDSYAPVSRSNNYGRDLQWMARRGSSHVIPKGCRQFAGTNM
jgi:hypothetical protein